ncbi:hypothetical protein OHT76_23355 [Streptomyces sp. NBC_00287]|uniref:hypothetical protein n=1 Tax=Streptomyces sp. NBC_00287 TaxID=2975702 RepID=UPI002E2A67A8|nr:hypothetical protein [Streptomyces sp. NBC_00287]
MSITPPSVPVLRGRKNTLLQFDGSALILRRGDKEHHIPLAAVALVRSDGRAVEVVLTASGGSAPPVVHRVEDVGESAAGAFASAVIGALPSPSPGSGPVDGSSLVTVRTIASEVARKRKRLWSWLGALAFVLVHVVETVLVTVAGDPALSVLVWMCAFCSGVLGLAALRVMPFGKPRWRLATDGVTVIARYKEYVDGMYVYDFTDLGGRPYAYAPHDYRGDQVELVYDPSDPFNGVERQFVLGRRALLFPMYLFGIPAVFFFLLSFSLLFAA